jgi:hypothetical protein
MLLHEFGMERKSTCTVMATMTKHEWRMTNEFEMTKWQNRALAELGMKEGEVAAVHRTAMAMAIGVNRRYR